MDAYAAHLAMAALVGASIVALSAYFMHRKTLTQVLEFARAERERDRGRGRERGRPRGAAAAAPEEDEDGNSDREADEAPLPNHYKRRGHQNNLPARRKAAAGYYRRGSASLPDVMTAAASVEDDRGEREVNGPFSVVGGAAQAVEDQRGLGIPPGLPRLHTFPEGTYESEHVMSDFSPH